MTTDALLGGAVDPDLLALMDAVFAEHGGAGTAHGGPVRLDAALWSRLSELGLVRLTGSEQTGGSGAGWPEAAELAAAAVRHAVRLPLAEHDLLAGWLLETAGLPVDDAVRTVAVLGADGTAAAVPWASAAQRIVLLWRDADGTHRVADVEPQRLRVTPGTNLIGEPRDTVAADVGALSGTAVADELAGRLELRAALVRAVQVAAALDTAVGLAIEHAGARTQFGRPLAKFQAVQHMIADIAAEAALARTAVAAALHRATETDWTAADLDFMVAVARSCVGHAADVVARRAHQLLGAIGTTAEHRLHHYTRAALAWRGEYGSVRSWDERVTAAAARAGADGLWSLIAG